MSSRHATTPTAPGCVTYWRRIVSPDGVSTSSSTNEDTKPVPSTSRLRTGHAIGWSNCIGSLLVSADGAGYPLRVARAAAINPENRG